MSHYPGSHYPRSIVIAKHNDLQYETHYRHSMIFYRGNNNPEWEVELVSIIEQAEMSDRKDKTSLRVYIQALMSPAFLRPFRCVGVLWMIYNMSGILILINYTATFLEVIHISACFGFLRCIIAMYY